MSKLKNELKKEVRKALEKKRLALFEKKKRGDRKTERRYVQLTESIDQLKRQP